MSVDIDHLNSWIGKTETASDLLSASQLAGLAATLDVDGPAPEPGDPVPPAAHWIFFNSRTKASELGYDGHAKLGGFLPPVELPRRMWAGGRISWPGTLRVGDVITRTSTIADVTHKFGKSGELVFVVVRHEVANDAGVCVSEEHDIVYRSADDSNVAPPAKLVARPAPDDAVWSRIIDPDPVMLFRYSALTFNGHRIHYDLKFVTEEGYPGLIVHGPLIATLLMDLCQRKRPDAALANFSYRAMSPLFDTAQFTVNGRPGADGTASLWAANAEGSLAMQADAVFDG
ncbi:MAG: acyl-CoA dehydrogenase [Rhodospirillaceae bacterium]|nr:acyl-CoA dehydrogenase [Rhodospirillaceae bacterium]MBT3910031.1 acyl-CoA dehydrogenase [Rhodospirillaceae bacterium]MBT5296857.1 acyl-CoA dehydrogenase [Rhodospirillaceae bacterium]MBT6087666.1 acyl-CoA dehydrogenase [Rhodospirillaceae bacterium]MBT6610216.1 acyl-CoA dehydrogenase [Rhodospirillaceae bacterium]